MKVLYFLTLLLFLFSCSSSLQEANEVVETVPRPDLEESVIYDKILGSLVGSAIGDAMGAPTEMWSRQDRQNEYGYIDKLYAHNIEPSPEGLWVRNLPAGATTDDTRWKVLIGTFLIENIGSFFTDEGPHPKLFSQQIIDVFQREVNALNELNPRDSTEMALQTRRMIWLQEWAVVSEAFLSGDVEKYNMALHKFYGGDLLCAGMLYAPAIGLPYPGNPEKAYLSAYRLGIFDQGYARDITGLTAAMVAAAMNPEATQDSVLAVFESVDPQGYSKSRLMGRSSFRTYQDALGMAEEVKKIQEVGADLKFEIPGKTDLESYRMQMLFEQLDSRNQDLPAHVEEILLVGLTAMIYTDFDFRETMEFITNYGRDNDTSAAVAGAILGAYHGFGKLPDDMKNQVLKANKEGLGIDLEAIATEISKSLIP